MSTLMALDRLPGHLDGYGAITAELAEAIMDCAASLNLRRSVLALRRH